MRDHEGNLMAYTDQEGWHSVDYTTPATLAMQHEDDDLDAAEVRKIPPDALLVLLRFLIPTDSSTRWRVATMRLAVLAHQAGLADVANLSQTELAVELKCTRALVSHYACQIVDQLAQAQPRGGKCRTARTVYRQSATEAHRKAGHRMSDSTTAPGSTVTACE